MLPPTSPWLTAAEPYTQSVRQRTDVPHRFARERIARNFAVLDSELCNELLLVFEFLSQDFRALRRTLPSIARRADDERQTHLPRLAEGVGLPTECLGLLAIPVIHMAQQGIVSLKVLCHLACDKQAARYHSCSGSRMRRSKKDDAARRLSDGFERPLTHFGGCQHLFDDKPAEAVRDEPTIRRPSPLSKK